MRKFSRRSVVICCTLMMVLAAVAVLTGCRPLKPGGIFSRSSSPKKAASVLCSLDASPTTQAALDRQPVAVMIENSPKARPQSGLTQACVVYEAITEGGITRFLAVYLHGNPKVVGPVRSSRPHFINLAREYHAAYVHCGQSYEALQILATDPTIYNFDQMKYAKPFWRDHSRKAPHNLYTSMEKLRAQMTKLGWNLPVRPLPSFTSTKRLTSGLSAKRVEIHFPGATHYQLRLQYDAKRGGYLRYEDGKLHVDRETRQPIVAKNVLIQRVYAAPFMQSTHGTYDVEVVGHGEGMFLSGGFQQQLRWQKDTIDDITQYTDEYNSALPYRPGQTWVEIIPVDGVVLVR